jgi:hypothetical protein
MKFVVVSITLLLAFPASGAVHINEVAWMGTGTSANDEWIELYNDGQSTSLDGWTLVAVDGSPSISLSGTIAGGGYFLLERTDDNSVPSQSADVIYTGALGNTGERLELIDGSGSVVHVADGSNNWDIGGNKNTFNTLTRGTDGWITATPTPKQRNSSENLSDDTSDDDNNDADDASENDDSSTTRSSSGGNGVSVRVVKDPDPLSFSDVVPSITPLFPTVGQEITFRCPDTDGKVTCFWNFGDGTVGRGEKELHTYATAGTYRVLVEAKQKKETAYYEYIVPVKRPDIAITERTNSGDSSTVIIRNDSPYDVSLEGWKVWHVGTNKKVLPEHTVVLAGATIGIQLSETFSSEKTKISLPHGDVVAEFPEPIVQNDESNTSATVTANLALPSQPAPLQRAEPAIVVIDQSPLPIQNQQIARISATSIDVSETIDIPQGPFSGIHSDIEKEIDQVLANSSTVSVASANIKSFPEWVWWTLIGLLSLGAAVLVVIARRLEDRDLLREALEERGIQ